MASFLETARDRLVSAYNVIVKGPQVGLLKDDFTIYRSLREVMMMGLNVVQFPYKQSVWTYACINAIADNLSRVPFVLKKDNGTNPDGTPKEPTVIEEGPLYDLFQTPNPYMTQEDLFKSTMVFLGLRGESIWILDGRDNVSQIPKQIWVFDPVRFQPMMDPTNRYHVGWVYMKDTPQQAFFSVSDVIFFRYFNPYNDIRGLAPIEASKQAIDQDFLANTFNTNFFKNGAELGGIISVEGELTDEQFNRALKQFEERHKGADKAHKIALIEGGGKFFEAHVNQRDMQFIEGKKLTRDEIMSAYKVNQVVLGLYKDVKSYEGIKSAHKAFWEECLMPKVKYIEGMLWSRLFAKIGVRRGRGKIWGEFDLATVGSLQINYADQVDIAFKMWSMGWPINAINKRLSLGMQEVKWGDEWWVPGGFLPVTALLDYKVAPTKPGKQPVNTPGPNGTNPPPAPAKKPTKDAPSFSPAVEIRELPSDDARTVVLGSTFGEQLIPIERTFRSKTKRFLFEQRKRALSSIYARQEGQSISIHLDKQKEVDRLSEALKHLYNEALGTGYTSFCSEQGLPSLPPDKGKTTTYVDSKASFLSKNFMDLTENLIEELTNYINRENPIAEEAADKAREIYNLLSGKCSLLSNKEAFIAYAYGRVLAIQRYGTEQHRQFIEPFMKVHLGNPRLEETRNVKSN